MKEARSIVSACFVFIVFLLCYAFVHPGSARGPGRSPRFLRMEVEELRPGRRPERHSVHIPYFLVGKAFRFAAMGAVHRELELQFDSDLPAESFRTVWADLKSSPEGTEVVRNHDGDNFRFRKEGEFVVLQVAKHSTDTSSGTDSTSEESSEGAEPETVEEEGGERAPTKSKAATPAGPPAPPAVAAAPQRPGSTPAAAAPPPLPASSASTDDDSHEHLTLRMPVRLVEAAIDSERDFDADALLSQMSAVNRGDLIDIRHHDSRQREAHVRIWVE
ncbi:MAG: hypothetical protein ABIT01_06410 [Thermoanaerobaculia bacterium]